MIWNVQEHRYRLRANTTSSYVRNVASSDCGTHSGILEPIFLGYWELTVPKAGTLGTAGILDHTMTWETRCNKLRCITDSTLADKWGFWVKRVEDYTLNRAEFTKGIRDFIGGSLPTFVGWLSPPQSLSTLFTECMHVTRLAELLRLPQQYKMNWDTIDVKSWSPPQTYWLSHDSREFGNHWYWEFLSLGVTVRSYEKLYSLDPWYCTGGQSFPT